MIMTRNAGKWLAIAVFLTVGGQADAAIRMPPIFGDHMVLQQDMPVPVWGTAAVGEKITV